MFKILLIPKAEYLTEYDVGAHCAILEQLDMEEHQIKKASYHNTWNKHQLANRPKLTYQEYMAKLDSIKQKREAVIVAAKVVIALFNNRDKAVEAIKFFRYYDDKYQKCEFEVVRAKK